MDERLFSKKYSVRKLTADDVEAVFALACENKLFYQYHPPFVTRESIVEDMAALPPGKEAEDKFFVGYFEKDALVAVMDLILNYPQEKTAFIGFFMTNAAVQNKGVGTGLVTECSACLRNLGFSKIRLAVDEGNPQSQAFWTKNHFQKTGERIPHGDSAYLPMELILSSLS